MADKQVGLKLDAELLDLATTVAQASRQSFKDLVSVALQREIERRLKGASGKKLQAVLDALTDYQASLPETRSEAPSLDRRIAEAAPAA